VEGRVGSQHKQIARLSVKLLLIIEKNVFKRHLKKLNHIVIRKKLRNTYGAPIFAPIIAQLF
jgi:hypothetical protein